MDRQRTATFVTIARGNSVANVASDAIVLGVAGVDTQASTEACA